MIKTEKDYFIYINLDGFGKYYYDLANKYENGTPNLNGLINEGTFFRNLYTGIPSITFPMQSSIVTGGYSNLTGNCYQYFDKKEGKLIKCNHDNEGETIGEVLNTLDKPFVSIQQFGLRDKGCSFDDDKFVYFQPGGNFKVRFQLLQDIISGKTVKSREREYVFESLPEFIFFYADDLDALGHNPEYTSYAPSRKKALTENDRISSVVERLKEIDNEIGKLVEALKSKGVYDKTTLLITSDHGMISYKGKSSLPKLIKKLNDMGFEKVTLIDENSRVSGNIKKNEVIIAGTGIQCQTYFNEDIDLDELKMELDSEDYIEKCLTQEELIEKGIKEEFADILISPKEFMHFNLDINKDFILDASHDSIHEKCQKVFGVIKGPKVCRGKIYEDKAYNIDMIPTACAMLSLPLMKDTKGKIIKDIII